LLERREHHHKCNDYAHQALTSEQAGCNSHPIPFESALAARYVEDKTNNTADGCSHINIEGQAYPQAQDQNRKIETGKHSPYRDADAERRPVRHAAATTAAMRNARSWIRRKTRTAPAGGPRRRTPPWGRYRNDGLAAHEHARPSAHHDDDRCRQRHMQDKADRSSYGRSGKRGGKVHPAPARIGFGTTVPGSRIPNDEALQGRQQLPHDDTQAALEHDAHAQARFHTLPEGDIPYTGRRSPCDQPEIPDDGTQKPDKARNGTDDEPDGEHYRRTVDAEGTPGIATLPKSIEGMAPRTSRRYAYMPAKPMGHGSAPSFNAIYRELAAMSALPIAPMTIPRTLSAGWVVSAFPRLDGRHGQIARIIRFTA
jgi:hypothetical protein